MHRPAIHLPHCPDRVDAQKTGVANEAVKAGTKLGGNLMPVTVGPVGVMASVDGSFWPALGGQVLQAAVAGADQVVHA